MNNIGEKKNILVDTSFLIAVFNKNSENHEIALKYFKYFLKNSIEMY